MAWDTRLSRRGWLALVAAGAIRAPVSVAASPADPLFARSDIAGPLAAPLAIGMARVTLRPGATAKTTVTGARTIIVESGFLAVDLPDEHGVITSDDLSATQRSRSRRQEIIMVSGTSSTVVQPGVLELRNPGARTVSLLDVSMAAALPHGEWRGFTTEDLSFQILAQARAVTAPAGEATITVERRGVVAGATQRVLPGEGFVVGYVEHGAIVVEHEAGAVATARAAEAAPFSQAGPLEPAGEPSARLISAGGTFFLPAGSAARLAAIDHREAEMLVLSVLPA
ncbi:MAG: hypothetical protein QM692_10815 [Thermomicrobiales bacterium]